MLLDVTMLFSSQPCPGNVETQLVMCGQSRLSGAGGTWHAQIHPDAVENNNEGSCKLSVGSIQITGLSVTQARGFGVHPSGGA